MKSLHDYSKSELRYRALKGLSYRLAKTACLFELCRRLTHNRLRIVAFHGFSLADEHEWEPGLFHSQIEFRKRLDIIKQGNYPVLDLDEAILCLNNRTLPRNATVITIDDGFYNNYKIGVPILIEYGFKHTIYVTTHYVVNQEPVFELLLQYAAWKSKKNTITVSESEWNKDLPQFQGIFRKNKLIANVVEYGRNNVNIESVKQEIAKGVCGLLGIAYDEIKKVRMFNLMTPDELYSLSKNNFTRVESHTHKHTIGSSLDDLEKELSSNLKILEKITQKKAKHFCYPSGVWNHEAWKILDKYDCLSAVTTEAGLNSINTPKYCLQRYLDRQNHSNIEFEAELSGYTEYLRHLKIKR